jgi:dTDP-4-dehydrorhamnose reductase
MNQEPITKNQSPRTVLITGSTGQLGSDLVRVLGNNHQIIPATRADFDITNLQATLNFIVDAKPDVILHPAAFTDVDGCESQQDKAFLVNGIGTRNVAIAAQTVDATLFYISTDYVFDGTKTEPYREYDRPNPQTIYGKSKHLGEEFVKEQLNKFFILRIAWLYGQHGNNFVKTMLKLAQEKKELQVVNDQYGTPTWTVDIAQQIKKLLATEAYGTYHCTSEGNCSWYEFALEIFKSAGYQVEVASDGYAHLVSTNQQLRTSDQELSTKNQEPRTITLTTVTSQQFPRPAKRPANSVLDNYMLRLQGLDIMPNWKEALKKFMEISQESIVSSQRSKGSSK